LIYGARSNWRSLKANGSILPQQFFSFASAVRQYTELTRRDRIVRRDAAVVMNGLLQSLELERKRVPGEILSEADRLESLFFAGYDPHFEGDEPPGL
jgi:hypothetical protein